MASSSPASRRLRFSQASIMKADFCAIGTQLTEPECQQRMSDFRLWDLAPDSRSISKTFLAKDFAEGLRFFNQIAQLSDVKRGHYPVKVYTTVEPGQDWHVTDSQTANLVLSTPAVKGLPIPDFNLAGQIDKFMCITLRHDFEKMKKNSTCRIGLSTNQDKDISDIHMPTKRLIKTSRKGSSGVSELSQIAQDLPPLQEDFDALKHGPLKLLSNDDLEERLKYLPIWKLSRDKRSISKTFQARNFAEGITFFNAVAKLAEEYDHFPVRDSSLTSILADDLHIMENQKVTVVLTARQPQGLSSLDITMADRFNNIDIKAPRDFKFSLQLRTLPQDPNITRPQVFEVDSWPEDSSPMQEVRPPDTSQQQSLEAAYKPQSKKSNKIPERQHVTPLMERTGEFEDSTQEKIEKGTPTLLHSLILVYAEAGPGGLATQEAVRRMGNQSLPCLREKGKAAQVAKVLRNHPDFVAGGKGGSFALRKCLLRSFQCGSLDPEEYADEKKMEATVLETYAASAAALEWKLSSPRSSLHTPNQKM